MRLIRSSFIVLQSLIITIALLSCEAPDSHKKNDASGNKSTARNSNTITAFVYRGMFDISGNYQLTDCSSGKQYKVSKKSELSSLDNAIKQMQNNLKKERVYIEAEGFVSTEQNTSTMKNDTVLVIGRILRIDMQFDCNPK